MDGYESLNEDRKSKLKQFFTQSIQIKVIYCVFISFGFFGALIGRDDFYGIPELLFPQKVGNTTLWGTFCDNYFQYLKVSCEGSYWVYRFSFGCALFFFINMFLASKLFCVNYVAKLFIQKSIIFWIGRFVLLLATTAIPFVIPDYFFIGYGWLSIFMSSIFLVIQLIIFIDWALLWQENWINSNSEDDEDEEKLTIKQILLGVFGVCFIIIGIIFYVAEIILFGIKKDCHINRVLIIGACVIGIILIVTGIFTGNGILPGSVIFCYSGFAVWSAINSNYEQCSTFESFFNPVESNTTSQIIGIVFSALFALITILKMIFSTSLVGFFSLSKKTEFDDHLTFDTKEDDEKREVNSIFYGLVVFLFSSFYFGTILNNWMVPSLVNHTRVRKYSIEVSIYSFVVKVISILVMFLLYFWSLIAKYVLKCRNFGDEDDENDF